MALATSSRPRPRVARARGSTWARTAYFCEPYTCTWATPATMEMRWASMVSAYSFTCDRGRVGEVSAMYRMGWSAGLTLRKYGGVVMSSGRRRCACEMADCTSSAAASMSRSRANWMVMRVRPRVLDEVMESMPAMVANWRSSGVATALAMVSGSAPESSAVTWMVGKSTLGRSLTGRLR